MNVQRRKKLPDVRHEICLQHFEGRKITMQEGIFNLPAGQSARRVQALPLIIREPQWVKFGNRYFYLKKEGLYRFWDWGKVQFSAEHPEDMPKVLNERKEKEYSCVILYRGDVLKLMGSIATIHLHGRGHQELSFSEQLKRMKHGCLSLTCGYLATFMVSLFKELGIKGRFVAGMCLGEPYNSYDNGHSLNEIYLARLRKWILVDADVGQVFLKNGRYLSSYEVSELIRTGKDFDLKSFMVPDVGVWDTSEAASGNFPSFSFSGIAFGNKINVKAWYRRVLRVPMVQGENGFYFYYDKPRDRERLLRYSSDYKAIDKKEWLRRFYS
jgi:hypothetical protein